MLEEVVSFDTAVLVFYPRNGKHTSNCPFSLRELHPPLPLSKHLTPVLIIQH